MKKVLILFGIGIFCLLIGLVIGLIHHGLLWPAIIILISVPCVGVGIFYHIHPKGSPILLIFVVSFGGAGVCWALWKHHLFAEMILASIGFLCVIAGLLQLERIIPRLPKVIKDLLQW